MATKDAWSKVIANIRQSIRTTGYWTIEARLLRDAAGVRRIGARNWQDIQRRLAEAGLETDLDGIPIESDVVRVQPLGSTELIGIGRRLLDELDRADREVSPIAMWRDVVVRDLALSRWASKTARQQEPEGVRRVVEPR